MNNLKNLVQLLLHHHYHHDRNHCLIILLSFVCGTDISFLLFISLFTTSSTETIKKMKIVFWLRLLNARHTHIHNEKHQEQHERRGNWRCFLTGQMNVNKVEMMGSLREFCLKLVFFYSFISLSIFAFFILLISLLLLLMIIIRPFLRSCVYINELLLFILFLHVLLCVLIFLNGCGL